MATKPSPDIPSSAEPFNAQEGPSKYGSTSSVKSDTVIVEQALPEDVEVQPVRGLRRGLSARQVQMIAIAGTIGTGLFLGTGRSLAQGGPASLIICYAVVGVVVYITLLLLGEMATQYPVAGSFNAYATRFFSPSYGFALSWNYWFNDSVSVASDLVAAQLLLQYWTPWHPWVISLLFWLFLVGVNSAHVKSYGELEYWLSSLKIVTIFIFIILGICVNAGVNPTKEYIGFRNWTIDGAPFIGGFGGFARVFVTASFAYGGTESLGITAGETKNPSKNMPRVVKFVFWRILIFYIISIFIICMNVPWDYPDLSNKSTTTSPFTIVFQQAGSAAAGSFMNTVIITSVLSAGNHALYAGTRVLYGLATAEPAQASRIFSWTTAQGVPLPALLATASISILCFGSSYIGTGQVWGWLQNIVGVSNQIAWFSIGISSWRFRKAWTSQGRKLDDLKFHMPWTKGWAPPFVAITTFCIILIQGWSSIFPTFITVDFISLYIQIPVMLVLFVTWSIVRKVLKHQEVTNLSTSTGGKVRYATDVVDVRTVDLNKDEYNVVEEEDEEDNERRERRTATGKARWLWKLFYWIV